MNIVEAKEYIKDTVELYLKKDEFGDYKIPVVRQRPIFLLGAPGIGKTAIMGQVASELNIALVSYSMTHHTRQSALGLPYIKEKKYGEEMVSVSEYTMSEIIASVYDTMEASGIKEGILFLDEINCVSETLYPSMLQFLQCKVFGKHSVPEGWVIVTAGNPPEFNKAVREFDVVTLDRLKVLCVEADFPAWKKYAQVKGLHGAIVGFLENNTDYFYQVETTAFGKNYVTARGWEDLSDILMMYEEAGKKVGDLLISQYIQNESVVKEFSAYYDLYNKYKKHYDVELFFEGRCTEKLQKEITLAGMDERLALTGLLLDRLKSEVKEIQSTYSLIKEIKVAVSKLSEKQEKGEELTEDIITLIKARENILTTRQKAGNLTPVEKRYQKQIIAFYKELMEKVSKGESVKGVFNEKVRALKEKVAGEQERVNHLFAEMEKLFGEESNEMLLLVTELTLNSDTAGFFGNFHNDSYEKFHALLMVGDRQDSLRKEILDIL